MIGEKCKITGGGARSREEGRRRRATMDAVSLLRALRQPRAGRPSGLARVVALAVVVGLVMLSAPMLIPVVRWFLALL